MARVRCARRYPAASAVGAGAFALGCVGIRCMVSAIMEVTVIDQPACLKTGGSHLKKRNTPKEKHYRNNMNFQHFLDKDVAKYQ